MKWLTLRRTGGTIGIRLFKKSHIPGSNATKDCGFYHQYSSVSSQLLLRISPNFFDYSSLSPMCLSSRNRSICKAFRHIMPYSAPLCKVLHYSKTGVPWQMKSTSIIYKNYLIFLYFRHLLPAILYQNTSVKCFSFVV